MLDFFEILLVVCSRLHIFHEEERKRKEKEEEECTQYSGVGNCPILGILDITL